MKKKIISFITVFVLSISMLTNIDIQAITFEPSDIDVICESAYLVNMDTDTVIYEKNVDEQLLPASLTKIMTAIIALEMVEDLEVEVEAPISVFNEIYLMNASNAGIMAFENVRMIDLLYALILPSGCEAGGIIADYVGEGDTQSFVDMMNAKALELGAENTYFYDAHGLDDDYSYTTAYDMYLITKYAMEIPLFAEIATTQVYEMPATNKHSESRNIYHTNRMLFTSTSYYCDYIYGIKTGTTGIDTKNLVTYAEKDGYTYMLVVLGGDMYDENGDYQEATYIDTQNLYDWAFDTIEMRTILNTDDEIAEIDVLMGKEQDYVIAKPSEEIQMLMPNDIELSSIQMIVTEVENLTAPIEKGDVVGTVTLKLKDEQLGTVDLVASGSISQDPFDYAIFSIKTFFQLEIVHLCIAGLIFLSLLYLILRTLYKRRKRQLKYQTKNNKKQ